MEKQYMTVIAVAVSMLVVGLLMGALGEELFEDDEENGSKNTMKALFDEPYEPAIDPADFSEVIDNPYLPLAVGNVWTYEGQTEDGLERIELRVLNDTKVVMGVTCAVVRDTVTVGGELVEDTYDWFAQDSKGNVWYFGEDSTEYEDGKAVSTEGSWEAGVDGAHAGIMMLAEPYGSLTYRQEYLKEEAEDMGMVISTDETVTVGGETYRDVVKIKDFTPIDPDAFGYKYYAPGVGVVLEEEHGERVELIEFTQG